MNSQVMQLLQKIGLAILEAIEEGDVAGAPAGILYAAMVAHGATLSQFQSFMSTLVQRSFVTLDRFDCYHLTTEGKAFKTSLTAKFGPSVQA